MFAGNAEIPVAMTVFFQRKGKLTPEHDWCGVWSINDSTQTATLENHIVVSREYDDASYSNGAWSGSSRTQFITRPDLAFDLVGQKGVVAFRGDSKLQGYQITYNNGVLTRTSGKQLLVDANINVPDLEMWSSTDGVICLDVYSSPYECRHVHVSGTTITTGDPVSGMMKHNSNHRDQRQASVAGNGPDSNLVCYGDKDERGYCYKISVDINTGVVTRSEPIQIRSSYTPIVKEFSVSVSEHNVAGVCYAYGGQHGVDAQRNCRAISIVGNELVSGPEVKIADNTHMILHEHSGPDSSIILYSGENDQKLYIRGVDFPAPGGRRLLALPGGRQAFVCCKQLGYRILRGHWCGHLKLRPSTSSESQHGCTACQLHVCTKPSSLHHRCLLFKR